jgi:hypothetical protein
MCSARASAATNVTVIIVPYSDERDTHLRLMLRHMHTYLRAQNAHYRMVVAEQVRVSTHTMRQ